MKLLKNIIAATLFCVCVALSLGQDGMPKKTVTLEEVRKIYNKSERSILSSSEVEYMLRAAKNGKLSFPIRTRAIRSLKQASGSTEVCSVLRGIMGDKTEYKKNNGVVLMATSKTLAQLSDVKSIALIQAWEKHVRKSTEEDMPGRDIVLESLEADIEILKKAAKLSKNSHHVPTMKLLSRTVIPRFSVMDIDAKQTFAAIENLARHAGAKKLKVKLVGINGKDKVSISVSKIPVVELVKMICTSHDLEYKVSKDTITITPAKTK